MTAVQAFCVLLAIFALGEIVAEKTRAILSATLVIAVVLLIAFWCGLPADIFDTAAVTGIANVLIGILITSMGTMIDFPELKRQWKTVVVSLVCVICGVALIVVVCPLLMGHDMAIAGAPIFAGANTAALLMTSTLTEKGLADLSSFVILVLVAQNFVGIPVASILLRKDAQSFLKDKGNIALYAHGDAAAAAGEAKRKLLELPKSLNKPSIKLLKLGLVAALSQFCAGLTNGTIHFFVFALLFGILFSELGFLEKNILPQTESNGMIVFTTTVIIFTNLANTTPQQLIDMLVPLLLLLVTGVVGVAVAGLILSKVLHMAPGMAISLGLTCTFGFPTTMFIPKEVANAMSSNEEERAAIENYMLPKMVTAGFVTVTISSVLIAGVVVKML